jgi:hypothetical protein
MRLSIIFAAAMFLSSCHAVGQQAQRGDTGKNESSQTSVPWYQKPEWIAVVLTGVYVGCTAYYVVVTHRMLGQIASQAETAKDSAKAALLTANVAINAERAWIGVWFENISNKRDREALYSINVTNRGRTPARITAYTLGDPNGSPTHPPQPKVTPVDVWMNPQDTKNIGNFDVFDTVDAEVWQEVRTQGRCVVFFGWIEYRAIIDKREAGDEKTHRTLFRWDWDARNSVLREHPPSTYYT